VARTLSRIPVLASNRRAPDAIAAKRAEADLIFHRVGITFAVYGDDQGTERLIPFRHHPAPSSRRAEWKRLEAGLRPARERRSNRFIHDIYHGQRHRKGRA